MGTPLIRAMNTIDLLHTELTRERNLRKAADACLEKITAELRSEFPDVRKRVTRHKQAYAKKARQRAAEEESVVPKNKKKKAGDADRLRSLLAGKEAEIESLCLRIDQHEALVERMVGKGRKQPRDDAANDDSKTDSKPTRPYKSTPADASSDDDHR